MLLRAGQSASDLLQRMQNEDLECRVKSIGELLSAADDTEALYVAFYYACPYLVDFFEAELLALWPVFSSFCQCLSTALCGLTEAEADAAKQIFSDRQRLGDLMLKALAQHVKLEQQKAKPRSQDYQLFIGCIASLYGDGCLGMKIRHLSEY